MLTDLNPWVVSFHLLCSLAIIGLAVLFLRRLDHPGPGLDRRAGVTLAWLAFAAALGRAVRRHRGHRLRPARRRHRDRRATDSTRSRSASSTPTRSSCSSGLTVGLLFALRAVGAPTPAAQPSSCCSGIELAQGTIGFVQYFTDLPIVLVGFHLLGAALISARVTWVLVRVREA